MAFALGFRDIDVKKTSVSCTVPNNDKARLMYYLHCMCTALDLSRTSQNLRRLRDYQNYFSLSSNETKELIVLCTLLNPITLTNKCIFHSEDACGDPSNAFYEINSRRTTFAAVQSVMIGSLRANVSNIMCYKMSWLKYYYVEPLKKMIN